MVLESILVKYLVVGISLVLIILMEVLFFNIKVLFVFFRWLVMGIMDIFFVIGGVLVYVFNINVFVNI